MIQTLFQLLKEGSKEAAGSDKAAWDRDLARELEEARTLYNDQRAEEQTKYEAELEQWKTLNCEFYCGLTSSRSE